MRRMWMTTLILSLGLILACSSVASNKGDEAQSLEGLPVQKELPDPFTFLNGEKVMSLDQWKTRRRPEIQKLFLENVYGQIPTPAPGITYQVTKGPVPFLNLGTYKEVTIRFNHLLKTKEAPEFRVSIFLPRKEFSKSEKAPVFLALNKCGNQEVHSLARITVNPNAFTMEMCRIEEWVRRGGRSSFWAVEHVLKRGFGFATIHESDITPDDSSIEIQMQKHFPTLASEGQNWGVIAAWAWGLSRVVDYLVKDPGVSSDQIIAVGHSRRGKAALLATALDERISMAIPHQSGTGGMALSRNNDQETVKKINDQFPHWFAGRFKKFNDNEDQLPVDQHLLVGLVAPRPLLATEGLKDLWANYKSGVDSLKGADPIYRLYGKIGIRTQPYFEAGEQITSMNTGRLLQYRMDTGHDLNSGYWSVFMDFADLHFRPQMLAKKFSKTLKEQSPSIGLTSDEQPSERERR